MQVNLPEAKSQLLTLVRAAMAGDEVVIADAGQPQVRLVPCQVPRGLSHAGIWEGQAMDLDAAFSDEADDQASQLFQLP